MCRYFGTKKIVLLNYPLGLFLLKYRNVWIFWNKKKSGSNRCSPLNSSIDKSMMSLLEIRRHFNIEVEIYYFCQFTILIPFLNC